ncbi:molybdopterin molybdenumtransferase MoeA [Sesbania bispinosa]|nr:molybdopterin molybdenumtransferase MoeA [Sesbania bispinosa]
MTTSSNHQPYHHCAIATYEVISSLSVPCKAAFVKLASPSNCPAIIILIAPVYHPAVTTITLWPLPLLTTIITLVVPHPTL